MTTRASGIPPTVTVTWTRRSGALSRDDAQRIADALDAAPSDNTKRSYRGCLKRFAHWCARRGVIDLDLSEIPAAKADTIVAAWLTDLHDDGRAPGTISVHAAALGARSRVAGTRDPRGPLTSATLRGLRRLAAEEAASGTPRGRGQVAGVCWAQSDAAATLAAAAGTLAGLRDAALLRVGSDAMLRVSELAALRLEDITPQADGSGTLRLHRSKTDQEAEGATLYLGPPTMQAFDDWCEAAGITAGPLWLRVTRRGWRLHQPHYPNPLAHQSIRPHPRRSSSSRRRAGPCVGTLAARRLRAVARALRRRSARADAGRPLALGIHGRTLRLRRARRPWCRRASSLRGRLCIDRAARAPRRPALSRCGVCGQSCR